MNSNEFEIYKAIRQVQSAPTIIRYICSVCKKYLNEWDVKARKAVCWKCRKTYWPKPKVEKRDVGTGLPNLVQLKDGLREMPVD